MPKDLLSSKLLDISKIDTVVFSAQYYLLGKFYERNVSSDSVGIIFPKRHLEVLVQLHKTDPFSLEEEMETFTHFMEINLPYIVTKRIPVPGSVSPIIKSNYLLYEVFMKRRID